jgi:hypothetical protein
MCAKQTAFRALKVYEILVSGPRVGYRLQRVDVAGSG